MKMIRTDLFIILMILCSSINLPAQTNLKKIFIADHYVNCQGVGQADCFQIKDSANGIWTNFYGHIEGFNYEEGYQYELMIEVLTIQNTQSDSPIYHYVFNQLIDKRKNQIHDKYKLDDEPWFLTKVKSGEKLKSLKDAHAFIVFHLDENKVSGNFGCNKFFGSVKIDEKKILFDKLGSTKMMCADEMNKIENGFMQQLPKANQYEVKGNQLFLYQNKSLLLVFKK